MGQGITMPGWRRRTVACPDSEEQSIRDSGQEQKQVGHEYAAGTAYERRFPRVLVRLMKSTFDQDEPGGASPADTEDGEDDSGNRRADGLDVHAD